MDFYNNVGSTWEKGRFLGQYKHLMISEAKYTIIDAP